MSKAWPKVPLGDVIKHRKQFIRVDDMATYKRCRVQLHAQGIVLRDEIAGSEIKTKTQQECRAGEFLVAEIDAKLGGYGIVPPELAGALVSSHYFLFEIDNAKLLTGFLRYFTKTPFFFEQVAAQGSTNYAAIRPTHVLNYEIPLPPMDEQHRLVAYIDALAAQVAKARRLQNEAALMVKSLHEQELSKTFGSLVTKYCLVSLEQVITESGYGTSIKCEYARGGNTTPVLRIPNIAAEVIRYGDLKFGLLTEKERERVLARDGDILVVRTNGSADLVGRCAVVKNLPEPMAFASYLIRLRCCEQRCNPDFVQLMLRHLRASGALFDFARTTAGQYNVSLGRLKVARIPLPPLAEQEAIVSYFAALSARVGSLRNLQDSNAVELNALLPSVLGRAFMGEL